MKILVNLFHSNLEKSTVNRRWLRELESHSELTINQPYGQYPDGIINITKKQQLLSEHDRMVFQTSLSLVFGAAPNEAMAR